MTTDDLRARAREAAEAEFPGNKYTTEAVTEMFRDCYVRGYLAHAAQQPTTEQIARAIAESQNPGVPGAFEGQRGAWLTDADAVLALLNGAGS